MHAKILRMMVMVLLMASPLNVTTAAPYPTSETAPNTIELSRPIESRPLLRPLSAGTPQTVTLQIVPVSLIVHSGQTAVVTATVVDNTGNFVPGVNLSGFITPSTRGLLSEMSMTDNNGQSTGAWTAGTAIGSGVIEVGNGVVSGTASINLTAGALTTITVQPPTAVISAGQRITYTAIATDTFGNLIGDVTISTTFSIAPASGGTFADNEVTPTIKNTWIVTGLSGSALGTAVLTATAAAFNRLAIENAPAGSGSAVNAATLNIYNTLPVYAAAYDAYSNLIGALSATWGGTGVVAGNLAPATGISTTFTPVVSGTGTITATSNGITNTTGTITVQAPEMQISKISSPITATPGALIQYTIWFTNTGNAVAQNVVITETYPPSVTIPAIPPPSLPPSSGNNVWSIGDLNPGDNGALIVYAQVPSQLPVGTVLTNVVRAGASNIATAIFTQTTAVDAQPAVSLNLSDSSDPVRVGDQYVYNLQYQNTGSAPVNSVRITLTMPSGAAYVSASPREPDINQPGYKVWLTNTLPADSVSRLIAVTMRVANPIADLTTLNTQATIDSNETTPYSTNESTLVYSPKFDLIKTANPALPTANELLTYTLSYANNGSTYASSVVVTDRIPISSSFVSCVPLSCSFTAGIVSWNLGQVNSGANGTRTATVRVNNNLVNGTVLTNTAGISTSVENVSDFTLLTNTVASAPNVSLSKSDGITTIAAGQLTTYTLSYANSGTAPASNVVITDRIPNNTTSVACSACVAVGGGVYSFTLGTLNATQNGNVTLSTRLATPLPAGLRAITNTARISTSTAGDSPNNNFSLDANDISTRPVLSLSVGYDSRTPYPGKIITYAVHYTNTSAMNTTGVVISTVRPAWLSSTPPGWTQNGANDLFSVGNLGGGQSGTVNYVLTLPLSYTLNMNAFSQTFTIQDNGPGGLPVAQAQSTAFIGVPDLGIARVIVPTSVTAGKLFSVTVVISNGGLGKACNPANVVCSAFYVDAFIDPNSSPLSYPFQGYGNPYANVPAIGAGGTVTVTMVMSFTAAQQPKLYFKVDNFDCSPSDGSNPCLPSHSLGGLVPEYNENNNVAGPIIVPRFSVYLPLVKRN